MLMLNHRSQGWSPETVARGGLMARRGAAPGGGSVMERRCADSFRPTGSVRYVPPAAGCGCVWPTPHGSCGQGRRQERPMGMLLAPPAALSCVGRWALCRRCAAFKGGCCPRPRASSCPGPASRRAATACKRRANRLDGRFPRAHRPQTSQTARLAQSGCRRSSCGRVRQCSGRSRAAPG
jgi:hypothetical protein